MRCNEHLWRKNNEHVEVKTNKNIQQNNVNGWQSLENYRKLSKTMKNTKPEGTTLKKQWKTPQNIENKHQETIMNNIVNNETHETHEKNQENNEK